MSESSLAIAQASVAAQTASTRQNLQLEIMKQQAQQEQGVVALLQQSAAQQQATLPAGQGGSVDITA